MNYVTFQNFVVEFSKSEKITFEFVVKLKLNEPQLPFFSTTNIIIE